MSGSVLEALVLPGAYGQETDSGPARIAIVAPRNGVSVRVASADAKDIADLESAGLAVWEAPGPSGRRRLLATPEGRARCARAAAPQGVAPFRAQHGSVERAHDDAASGAPVFVDRSESPLMWLATRKGRNGKALVDAAGLQAGERLRRDLTSAGIMPRTTADWSAAGAGGRGGGVGQHFSDVVIAARQRVTRALDAVGPDFAGLLVDVCGFLKGLETIESERGWPARSAKVVLVLALAQLARHYGIAPAATGPAAGRGVLHWGAADYRPQLDAGVAAPPG